MVLLGLGRTRSYSLGRRGGHRLLCRCVCLSWSGGREHMWIVLAVGYLAVLGCGSDRVHRGRHLGGVGSRALLDGRRSRGVEECINWSGGLSE